MKIAITIILSLFIVGCHINSNVTAHTPTKNINISILNSDYSELSFASISILKKGFQIKDTNANLSGNFKLFYKSKDIKDGMLLIFSYSASYPKILTLKELILNPKVILMPANFIYNKKSVPVDTVLNNINSEIEELKNKWIKK